MTTFMGTKEPWAKSVVWSEHHLLLVIGSCLRQGPIEVDLSSVSQLITALSVPLSPMALAIIWAG